MGHISIPTERSSTHVEGDVRPESTARVRSYPDDRPIQLPSIAAIGLLLTLSASITLVEDWVGRFTLYSQGVKASRLVLHEGILHNRLPDGAQTWRDLGANGLNTRVTVVYLAEAVRLLTGLDVNDIYRLIDSIALFAALVALFLYLKTFVPPVYALVGVLYLGAVLPLTFLFAYFHPWDRVSLLLWITLLVMLRTRHYGVFALLLTFSVTVKYDTLLLPGLYWLVRLTRRDWRAVTAQTVCLFVITFGTWYALRWAFPSGFASFTPLQQIRVNLEDFRGTLITFPPLLGFAVPLMLATIGLRHESRFVIASAAFGILLLPVFALLSNFREFRAELPALILIMPAALGTLMRLEAMSTLELPVGTPDRGRLDLVLGSAGHLTRGSAPRFRAAPGRCQKIAR